jgi:hypothetical protein
MIKRGYAGNSFPADPIFLLDTIRAEYPNDNRESVFQIMEIAEKTFAFIPKFTATLINKRHMFHNVISGINFENFPQIARMLGAVWVEESPPKLILEMIANRLKMLMRLALWNHNSPQQIEEIFKALRTLIKDKTRADEMIESLIFFEIK